MGIIMKLYRMELYKLCHRKIVIIGAFFVIVVQLLFCAMKVSEEWAYVDGVLYEGRGAVRINRQITEEFKGVLTDEKVNAIIAKYGFPQEVVREYGGFRDSNFLNAYITDYLADGFMRGWEEGEYQVSTRTYPIAETELGAAEKLTGRKPVLEYTNGWSVFIDVLNGSTMLGSILIILTVSVLFAGERQAKMVPLLFTTKEGRKKDIYAKIAAAFTVTVCVWLSIVVLDLILCGYLYGLDGLESLVGTTRITGYLTARSWSVSIWTVGHFLTVVLLRSFVGVLMLCAATIYISAGCSGSFHAVSVAAIFWGMPVLLWFLLPSGPLFQIPRFLLYASPLYHVMCTSVFDIGMVWPALIWISLICSAVWVVRAYLKYRRQQR